MNIMKEQMIKDYLTDIGTLYGSDVGEIVVEIVDITDSKVTVSASTTKYTGVVSFEILDIVSWIYSKGLE